jgi:hypothetical protein
MTPSQASYLETLSQQTGEDVPTDLTKAAASEKIDELRAKVGLEGDGTNEVSNTPISPNANR